MKQRTLSLILTLALIASLFTGLTLPVGAAEDETANVREWIFNDDTK